GLKKIEGILVQEMVSGNEIAIGMKRDEQFGPVLMAGLGGIFIEIIKDVTFRVAPIEKAEAMEMIKELKGYKLLQGFRGKPGVNIDKLAALIVNVSNMVVKENKVMALDFNPVIANDKSVVVADFRVII
ncbi:MAG: acetate--CoA ligase family protein, partial [Candidatus Pacebacteria bacterium]|nr:acetate--CoA ligase family protein [Candidatus Paceibacterota bacterium]